ncbi:MAG: DUF1329 domain-containing protein [Azonexus sp.]|jgi:hypothetical protein|nr:DUF1329 domain-containing protein [Azonexus sp.]
MNVRNLKAAALVAALGLAASVAVAADEERLPWGAIKAGNKEGTIPAYTGGLPDTTSPPGFKKDSGFWPDPFADDKPLYKITGANVDQYADKLSEGTKALLKRFPTYSVSVYPTRRSVAYPDWVIENMKKNAANPNCKMIKDGLGVEGCFGGTPFPNPKNGKEAIWNMLLAYNKGYSSWTYGDGWYVDSKGNKAMTAQVNNRFQSEYYNPNITAEQFYADGGFYYGQSNVYSGPARSVGEGNLLKKYLDGRPDRQWSYSPGQRRVRQSPDTAYDFPVATSGGVMLYDEIYLFGGQMDRFDWKLVGMQEMIIPYNAWRWTDTPSKEMLMDQHPNPDVMRWELHRVWVVEATLKEGARHVRHKRRYYIDEDSGGGVMDGWDAAGKLSVAIYSPINPIYDKKIARSASSWYYDFNTGVYYHSSLGADRKKGEYYNFDKVDASFYTPEGFARRTAR